MKKPKLPIDLDEDDEIEPELHILNPVMQDNNYSRYILISGSTYNIVLASDDKDETIDYLIKKGLYLIKKIKENDR